MAGDMPEADETERATVKFYPRAARSKAFVAVTHGSIGRHRAPRCGEHQAMVSSATERALAPGVLRIAMPRASAAARSMASVPAPWLPMTASRGAAAMALPEIRRCG